MKTDPPSPRSGSKSEARLAPTGTEAARSPTRTHAGRPPELVAHRGYARRYPENTLCAMEAAIRAGARFVECDVQLSRDGFPVLMHDRTLERMCGVKAAVHEMTLSELRKLSCGEPGKFGATHASEGIASLGGFIDLIRANPHVTAFVEIKRIAIEQFGRERILEKVLPPMDVAIHQCAFISFSLEFLAAARAAHPIPLGAVFDTWKEREQPLVAELDPEYVFCDVDGLPASGQLAHARSKIAVYEVADPALAMSLAARGVHMVETFAIAEMVDALR